MLRFNGRRWDEFSAGTEAFLYGVWGDALDNDCDGVIDDLTARGAACPASPKLGPAPTAPATRH